MSVFISLHRGNCVVNVTRRTKAGKRLFYKLRVRFSFSFFPPAFTLPSSSPFLLSPLSSSVFPLFFCFYFQLSCFTLRFTLAMKRISNHICVCYNSFRLKINVSSDYFLFTASPPPLVRRVISAILSALIFF